MLGVYIDINDKLRLVDDGVCRIGTVHAVYSLAQHERFVLRDSEGCLVMVNVSDVTSLKKNNR